MTRNATFGALVFALLMVTSGLAGAAAATPTAADATASDASPAPFAQETTTTQGNQTENATASVTFEDQQTDGSAVVINETNLSEGGYVVVFAQNGTALGNTSYLDAGTHENLTVDLDTSISSSQVLVAVPHMDTDDDQMLDFNATRAQEVGPANATDGPYIVDGVPVSTVAFVTVGDDTTRRTTTTAAMASPER